jgi:hypothetical protein
VIPESTRTSALAPSPSGRTLVKATAAALLAAVLVLVVALLPAEYGIDPLGTGRALGLLNLFGVEASPTPATIAPTAGGPVFSQTDAYRTDSHDFTLGPYETVEYKYELNPGATMVYSWSASEDVGFDFHTEPAGKPASASETFEKGTARSSHGAYVAPYAGIHGWFWENPTGENVVITLNASGFFSHAKLFPFNQKTPQDIDLTRR